MPLSKCWWVGGRFGAGIAPSGPSDPPGAEAVDVHQLWAGRWGRSEQYLHRIGRRPTAQCAQCSDVGCPAGLCLVCGEEIDTPAYVLLRCPCLLGQRLRTMGNINHTENSLQPDDVVAELAAGYLAYYSRTEVRPPHRPAGGGGEE